MHIVNWGYILKQFNCDLISPVCSKTLPKHKHILYNVSLSSVYKHWPDAREFITRIVELWNRWIRVLC